MTRNPLAHRDPVSGREHLLLHHVEGTAALAADFAAVWRGGEAARLAGLWHDLGKYGADFQDKLLFNPDKRVNHSTAGAYRAVRFFQETPPPHTPIWIGSLLAYIIAGHHAGLPDGESDQGNSDLRTRLRSGGQEFVDRAQAQDPPQSILAPTLSESPMPPGDIDFSLWVRMTASAVFDADFLDTEAFYDPEKGAKRGQGPNLESLQHKLDAHLRGFQGSQGPVNAIRAEILAACREAAARPPGLFSLTVPTGGGKTLSSLAFALGHARAHGLRRIIYAVPFTSIIEQTAMVFREALGEEAVLEHHSALDPAKNERNDGNAEALTTRARLAAENWDAPLIVTTTVQLFESLFANRPSRLRKIHNIAGSVVILDEAQALPAPLLLPITKLLGQLVAHFKVSVVLCTATQPALRSVFQELPTPVEIAPDLPRLFTALDRVRPRIHGDPANRWSWEAVAEQMAEQPQALAIVNTRADARRLVDILKEREPEGVIHLSTWQCAAHRVELLKTIRDRLREGQPCRVVSTSLVEAGVDLDFPLVLRAMAGLDSLAQAAGRCNREGKLPDKGRFIAFWPEGDSPGGSQGQAIEATEAVLRTHSADPFRPESFEAFFQELYWAKGVEGLDAKGIQKLLTLKLSKQKSLQCLISFKTASERFQMIEEGQESVIIPNYTGDPKDKQAVDLIEQLRHAGPSRELLRKLQPFTVPLTKGDFKRLWKLGAFEEEENLTVLVRSQLYDSDLGLEVLNAERVMGQGNII